MTTDTQNPSNDFMVDLPVNNKCFNNTKTTIQNPVKLFSFWTIQENINSIILPTAWSRHDIPEKLIIFSYYIIKEEDTEMPTPIILKRVCLYTNLMVKCSVLGKDISVNIFDIQEIRSIAVLEELLNKFNSSIICKGYQIDSYLKTQNSYIDPVGNVRHIMCQLILEKKKDICQYCTCAMRSVNRKKLRMSKNNKTTERINIILSPRKQPQLKRLQMKYKLVRQQKIRAEALNKKQKSYMSYLHNKMSALSSLSLEDRLINNFVPYNQRIALTEIVSASKVKNKKGRRYSENWSLLCMLFHIRSPCGYNFLLNNDILPLPCVRTIRR